MVNDLSEYFSQKQRIEALEKEVQRLKVEHDRRMKLQCKKTAHYKAKWRLAIGEHELPTDKARKLIKRCKQGQVSNVSAICRAIAKQVGLSVQAVRVLWYER